MSKKQNPELTSHPKIVSKKLNPEPQTPKIVSKDQNPELTPNPKIMPQNQNPEWARNTNKQSKKRIFRTILDQNLTSRQCYWIFINEFRLRENQDKIELNIVLKT